MNDAVRTTSGCTVMLWMREDLRREDAMAYWKGPHHLLVAASPGFETYRQHHLPADPTGIWPPIEGVETDIPADRRFDGAPEVILGDPDVVASGAEHEKLIHADERNVFGRTILHATGPGGGRVFSTARQGPTAARALVMLRKRPEVSDPDFTAFVHDLLGATLAYIPSFTEVRTQVFIPWTQDSWETPGVAHDYPEHTRFHASLIVGAADSEELRRGLGSDDIAVLEDRTRATVSAIHAYPVSATYTYVEDGVRIG